MPVEPSSNEQLHRSYVSSLRSEECDLVRLRDELYEGSWDFMQQDLRNRLFGKPYIFKLVNKIESDLETIEKLKDYEQENKINLADYL